MKKILLLFVFLMIGCSEKEPRKINATIPIECVEIKIWQMKNGEKVYAHPSALVVDDDRECWLYRNSRCFNEMPSPPYLKIIKSQGDFYVLLCGNCMWKTETVYRHPTEENYYYVENEKRRWCPLLRVDGMVRVDNGESR